MSPRQVILFFYKKNGSGDSAKWRRKLRRPLAKLRTRAQRSQLQKTFAALVYLVRGGSVTQVRVRFFLMAAL